MKEEHKEGAPLSSNQHININQNIYLTQPFVFVGQENQPNKMKVVSASQQEPNKIVLSLEEKGIVKNQQDAPEKQEED